MVLKNSLEVLVLEIVNFTVNIVFLALFIYRYSILQSFSKTQKYKDYFPKMRIFFSVVYVVINIALLVETLTLRNKYDNWLDIVLIVLGQGIDSIIIVIQLLVLRLQLMKEQPYTPFHIAYFVYLVIFSVSRLIIFQIVLQDSLSIISLILSCILVGDSLIQLTYWIFKKQSLPQFKVPTNDQIDALKYPSKFITNAYDIVQKSFRRNSEDHFPYIIPFVFVDNGRIKVILQIKSNQQNQQQGNTLKFPDERLNPQVLGDTKSQQKQILGSSYFSTQQIKHLYIICSRFPLSKSLNFNLLNASLHDMAKQLQQFLIELFRDKRHYQSNVLKYFKIPLQNLKEYSDLVEKFSIYNKDTELDQTLGLKLDEDKNAIFFSVNIYKHLWVYDHYQFYIKIEGKISHQVYYPIKRFSEFQEFHARLKHQVRLQENRIMLPDPPKKHLFHWNEDQQINQRRAQLQKYLRILSNDQTILSIPVFKESLFWFLGVQDQTQLNGVFQQNFYNDLRVMKGDIKKSLIKKDFVTYYEFKLFQKGIQIGILCKRFSQFQQLHNFQGNTQELQRWMNNIQITYKAVSLPERLYYKSQSDRHQKLKNYLQKVVEIRDVGKVYAVNSFFNVCGNKEEIDISQIVDSVSSSRPKENTNHKNDVNNEIIELTDNIYNPRISQSSESSARRFSQIMNNLGQD